jgi:hypothetical protein
MSNLPLDVSESTMRRNPHLYPVYAAQTHVIESTTAPISGKRRSAEPEKVLQEQCVSFLRQRNIICNRSRTDRKKTDMVGWPDLTFVLKQKRQYLDSEFTASIPCAFECKLPGEKPTEDQERVMAQLMENGWEVRVITSLQQFIEIVAAITV